jgi:hypothetical protein
MIVGGPGGHRAIGAIVFFAPIEIHVIRAKVIVAATAPIAAA